MIRVVVIEDDVRQREQLVRILQADGDIHVAAQATAAADGIAAVAREKPDVVTLDLQLHAGAGQHVIEQVMAFSPTPILVLSDAVTDRESAAAVEALVAGATDLLPKPAVWDASSERGLRERVRLLRGVTVLRHPRGRRVAGGAEARPAATATPVVAIAASSGGPAALADVLAGLGDLDAAVLVVQHLHRDFVTGLVSWMARVSKIPVELARDGELLQRGLVLIGPADVHLKVARDDVVRLDPEPQTLHRPSADELFTSLAAQGTRRMVGVVLTGMGDDGASGLLALRAAGAETIVQDEGSSAVFGMPRAAQLAGGARQVLPLAKIPDAIQAAVRR